MSNFQANRVACRDDNNPKAITEIHKDAQKDGQQKAAMAAAYELNKQQGGSGGRLNSFEADKMNIYDKPQVRKVCLLF